VNFHSGGANLSTKNPTICVRAFRCVSY
jgi:hypothetical protein